MPFEASANEIKSNVDLLVAKHMPLFIVALMFVTMFAVLGMWTTFWPLVWCAVPSGLCAMVAAGLKF